ncbi:hypothetical protein F5882DRAFT_387429 [Hyaloscypha sp. PMI_1271]|nr:hypothetical protein F5882DRAFT_387429 [Hyaloscypha sp. PMI_1271]
MQTRNSAPKPLPLSGFKTTVQISQYLSYGGLDFQTFMRPENAPFSTRMIWYFRRTISSLFGSTLPCRYIIYNRQSVVEHGYLIMDYIETTEAEMLSESWDELRHDRNLRTNFFKDLSHIMLALSQSPLPRIGSWTIDERGVLMLTNRPLAHHFHSLENEGIPTNIPRNLTYMTTDAYYTDLLGCHDSRIRNQPNSMINEEDGLSQMANLFTMRGLLPYFTTRDLRHGPFVFNLTDLHRGNIFVDSNWHIKYIIDLEWACSLPIEMLAPPYWITNRGVDELKGEELQKFENACEEFMDIFEEEEKSFPSVYGSAVYRADIMRRG